MKAGRWIGPGGRMAVLELAGIAKHFGAIEALKGVDLALGSGEVLRLMGGKSSIYGAALFVIRNSLIMFGVDANWYDFFVGLFIILAVLLERLRSRQQG